ncbi:hypothetical protein [Sinomonas susongensis]|uniref:hypothetical protein n=1 Tax=Sinomonas susongensis TaxID=1324851 RepID=UPI00110A0237|nr:hypothetical protein [Sinomonas susongensis]
MDELERLGEECAAGQMRRDNGIKIATIAILVLVFGTAVPMRPNVTSTISLVLLITALCMITSGRRKIRHALDGLVRELQEH